MADDTLNANASTIRRLRLLGWSGAVLLMLLPLLAMQFTDEVYWTAFDFVLLGALLLAVAVPLEILARRSANVTYLLAAGVALLSAFLLVLVNGAVGIIGKQDNPANLMYFGVLAVGIGGAVVTRARAAGMVRVMYLTAVANVLVAAIAVAGNMTGGTVEAISVTAFFVIQFVVAALLFQRAAAQDPPGQG